MGQRKQHEKNIGDDDAITDEAPTLKLKQVIDAFFDAENRRDWPRYAAYLHPAVEWTVFDGSVGRTVSGRSAYVEAMKNAYEGTAIQFRCIQAVIDESRDRVATWLIDDEGNRSLDVFDLQDGLIKNEWEYLLGLGGLELKDELTPTPTR